MWAADLQGLWEVVVHNDLQDQLLSSDDEGWKIQGQEEILEHRELETQSHGNFKHMLLSAEETQLLHK